MKIQKISILTIALFVTTIAFAQKDVKLESELVLDSKGTKISYPAIVQQMKEDETFKFNVDKLPKEVQQGATSGFLRSIGGKKIQSKEKEKADWTFVYDAPEALANLSVNYKKTSVGYMEIKFKFNTPFKGYIVNANGETVKTIIVNSGNEYITYYCQNRAVRDNVSKQMKYEFEQIEPAKQATGLQKIVIPLDEKYVNQIINNDRDINDENSYKYFQQCVYIYAINNMVEITRDAFHMCMSDNGIAYMNPYITNMKEKNQKDYPELVSQVAKFKESIAKWIENKDDASNVSTIKQLSEKFAQDGESCNLPLLSVVYNNNAAIGYAIANNAEKAKTLFNKAHKSYPSLLFKSISFSKEIIYIIDLHNRLIAEETPTLDNLIR